MKLRLDPGALAEGEEVLWTTGKHKDAALRFAALCALCLALWMSAGMSAAGSTLWGKALLLGAAGAAAGQLGFQWRRGRQFVLAVTTQRVLIQLHAGERREVPLKDLTDVQCLQSRWESWRGIGTLVLILRSQRISIPGVEEPMETLAWIDAYFERAALRQEAYDSNGIASEAVLGPGDAEFYQ